MPKNINKLIYLFIFLFSAFLFTNHYEKYHNNKDTVSLEEFEKIKKQIQSLKRIQDVLIKNEEEHFNNHSQEKAGDVVFPRIDNYCPSTMIYHEKINQVLFIDNLCDFEKRYWK